MFVKMIGLYHYMDDVSWYRESGDCFNIVSDKKLASDMSEDKCKKVLKHKDFYLKQFCASEMVIEE